MKEETRRQEIVRIASVLFKERGYSAVTMRDIANELGIKAASLYNHIKSKQEILHDIIISLAEDFTAGMELIFNANDSNIGKLQRIIELHVHITTNNQYGMASLNNDWMHLEESLDYYLNLRTDYEDNFRNIIKSGIASGEIINVNPEVMLFSILSTLRSLYLWIPKKEDLLQDTLANDLGDVLLKGITL
ncbi:MAG: TetR/AcrR family transcriptional regulator [Flavobacteriaceae bacterium]|nr:TetR/AcrR family transcriptional regulator [Flavobacteriaceae bacterium]